MLSSQICALCEFISSLALSLTNTCTWPLHWSHLKSGSKGKLDGDMFCPNATQQLWLFHAPAYESWLFEWTSCEWEWCGITPRPHSKETRLWEKQIIARVEISTNYRGGSFVFAKNLNMHGIVMNLIFFEMLKYVACKLLGIIHSYVHLH